MKINITETVLRDANQSLIATRMPMSDFEPILETMDQAGYYAAGVLGRRHVRLLPALSRRRPLGAPAQDPQGREEHQAADAAARPEPAGL